jgi:phage baseplate assembly protein W
MLGAFMANTQIPYAFRRDISWDLTLDEKGDIKMVEDEDAIKQSIYTILTSNLGDKNMEYYFGANIESLLFENANPIQFIQADIANRIKAAIEKYEPNVVILAINVDVGEINNNKITVTIPFLLSDGVTQGLFQETISLSQLKR